MLKPKSEDEGVRRTQLLEPGRRTRRAAVQMCVKLCNSLVAGGQLCPAVSLTVRGETNITSRKWGTEYGWTPSYWISNGCSNFSRKKRPLYTWGSNQSPSPRPSSFSSCTPLPRESQILVQVIEKFKSRVSYENMLRIRCVSDSQTFCAGTPWNSPTG